jgi:hypothetical protein
VHSFAVAEPGMRNQSHSCYPSSHERRSTIVKRPRPTPRNGQPSEAVAACASQHTAGHTTGKLCNFVFSLTKSMLLPMTIHVYSARHEMAWPIHLPDGHGPNDSEYPREVAEPCSHCSEPLAITASSETPKPYITRVTILSTVDHLHRCTTLRADLSGHRLTETPEQAPFWG